jgi:hypothetical protein
MAFPSTFLDLQNAVLQKARLDPVLDGQRVKDWINQTYSRVCLETEATVATATMNVSAGAYSYTFPVQVARCKQLQLRPYGTTTLNAPLVRTTLDELLQRRQAGGDSQLAQPTHYALLGINDFELWPTPAAADTILFWFVQFPTPLAANADVPLLEEPYASKLLEYGALSDAGDFNGDPSTIEWDNAFSDWFTRYQTHLERKQGVIPGQFHQWGDPWAASGYDPADAYGY